MSKIYYSGDTHGDIDIEKIRKLKESGKIQKGDILIILGDFGCIWDGQQTKKEKMLLDFYDSLGLTVFFLPGNHENYDRLFSDEFPLVSIPETNHQVKQISQNVFMLLHAIVYNINGKEHFVFRGGKSIDANYRIQGRSWWPQETLNDSEYKLAKNVIRSTHIDYIISHVGPNSFKNKIFGNRGSNYRDITEDMLENVICSCPYIANICGHYHIDVYCQDYRVICLYETILDEQQIQDEINNKSNILQRI